MTNKKITLSTVKSFIKKNFDVLYIKVKGSFDGMTDGVERVEMDFEKVVRTNEHPEHHHGVYKTWFVGSSRDYFTAFENETFTGIEVSNSCGSFILAVKKVVEAKKSTLLERANLEREAFGEYAKNLVTVKEGKEMSFNEAVAVYALDPNCFADLWISDRDFSHWSPAEKANFIEVGNIIKRRSYNLVLVPIKK